MKTNLKIICNQTLKNNKFEMKILLTKNINQFFQIYKKLPNGILRYEYKFIKN